MAALLENYCLREVSSLCREVPDCEEPPLSRCALLPVRRSALLTGLIAGRDAKKKIKGDVCSTSNPAQHLHRGKYVRFRVLRRAP
jgi:hypothetical protein